MKDLQTAIGLDTVRTNIKWGIEIPESNTIFVKDGDNTLRFDKTEEDGEQIIYLSDVYNDLTLAVSSGGDAEILSFGSYSSALSRLVERGKKGEQTVLFTLHNWDTEKINLLYARLDMENFVALYAEINGIKLEL